MRSPGFAFVTSGTFMCSAGRKQADGNWRGDSSCTRCLIRGATLTPRHPYLHQVNLVVGEVNYVAPSV